MKKTTNNYTIICDTNAFIPDKLIIRQLLTLFNQYNKHSNLKLSIKLPLLVYEEGKRHFISKILLDLRNHSKLTKLLNDTFKKNFEEHLITENEQLKRLFDDYVSNKIDYSIIEPDYKNIDVKKLSLDAVWRKSPFEEKGEKGFRDRVIFETISHYLVKSENEVVIFVSNDEKLFDLSKPLQEKNKKFTVYKSLDEVDTYLKIVDKDLKEITAHRISEIIFYYFYENIYPDVYKMIKNKFPDVFKDQPRKDNSTLSLGETFTTKNDIFFDNLNSYNSLSINSYSHMGEKVYISNPNLVDIHAKKFKWTTLIKITTTYKENMILSTYVPQLLNITNEFEITWMTSITDNNEVSKHNLDSEIKHLSRDIRRNDWFELANLSTSSNIYTTTYPYIDTTNKSTTGLDLISLDDIEYQIKNNSQNDISIYNSRV